MLKPPTLVYATLAGLASFAGTPQCLGQQQQPAPYSRPLQVRPNLPGSLSDEVGLRSPAPLAREGSFVSNGRGQAVKGKSGRWFFVFDPDSAGRTLPPMVILPNQNLAAIERLTERTADGTRMAVTGSVTAYQGLNYLLPSAPPLLIRVEESSPGESSEPSRNPTDVPTGAAPQSEPAAAEAPAGKPAEAVESGARPTPSRDEPSIDEIVARMDQAAGRVAATSPQRATIAIDPGQGVRNMEPAEPGTRSLVAPGMLVSRRGRIARATDGAMVFIFDSGTDGGSPAPLVLLPCQNLTAIEQIGERSGEAATYTVTGEVMTYRGRNYLLVRSYQANRASDQVMPAQ
jgi:hypothetical protein